MEKLIKLDEAQNDLLIEQWMSLVHEREDYRPSFLAGFKDLTVEQLVLDLKVGRKFIDEQVANLAVIVSSEVGVDLSSGELKVKPQSGGEKLLSTLLGSGQLKTIVPLLTAFLKALHLYLYREAEQDRNVVRTLIFVPGNEN